MSRTCCWPSSVAALRLWADMSMNAFIAKIASLHITHAGIVTARSARRVHAINGWPSARKSCCRSRMSMSFLHCLTNWPHWPIKTNASSMICYSRRAATLLELAADPKHLGAEIGFLSVLHTRGQTLQHNPHVHCVIPAGGPSADHTHWVHADDKFFLPVKASESLSRKIPSGTQARFQRRQDPVLRRSPIPK